MKLLIIGSDYGVIDIIKEAHKMGAYVIVADYYETTPAKKLADESWTVSTTDIDKLEELSRKTGVEAVFMGASDFNINNGRQLCKRLGLPIYCESDRAWEVASRQEPAPDFVVNLQGDVPTCPPDFVVKLIKALEESPNADVASVYTRLSWEALDVLRDSKKDTPFSGTTVVTNPADEALWFSKNIIPAFRDEKRLRKEYPG